MVSKTESPARSAAEPETAAVAPSAFDQALPAALVGVAGRVFAAWQVPRDDREDLFQDACVRYLAARAAVVDPEAWFAEALRNRIRDLARRRAARRTEAVDAAALDELADGRRRPVTAEIDTRAILAALAARPRRILAWVYLEEATRAEVAARLGVGPESVRKLRARAEASARAAIGRPLAP
jgi:RNA polymerase sigma factor (sigma-70 family)